MLPIVPVEGLKNSQINQDCVSGKVIPLSSFQKRVHLVDIVYLAHYATPLLIAVVSFLNVDKAFRYRLRWLGPLVSRTRHLAVSLSIMRSEYIYFSS